MKKEKLIDAITEIDPDVLDRYFSMKKGFSTRKKPHKQGWVKWVVVAACLGLLITTVFAASSEHNQPFKEPVVNNGTELKADDALVSALVEYLNELEVDHDMPTITTADKMDAVRDGQQALHVAFDPSKPYFVCAYSADGQKNGEYTWLKYTKVGDITKEYSDLQMALAFQVNPSLFVKDIMTEDAEVPTMEHFQPFEPQFNEGLNTKAADTFDETFIYLNSSEGDTVYHSTTAYDHEWVTLPCRYLDGEYYYVRKSQKRYGDVFIFDYDDKELGDYYLGMQAVTHSDPYEIIKHDDGGISYILMVKVDWFADVIESAIIEDEELKNFFEFMEKEELETDEIGFFIQRQFHHYAYGKADKSELDNDFWIPAEFTILLGCNYDLATDEEWYKACEDTEFSTLNTAFFNEYCADLSYKYCSLRYTGGLELDYQHADENCPDEKPLSDVLTDFYKDYEFIKSLLAEKEYITKIAVVYTYSFYAS